MFRANVPNVIYCQERKFDMTDIKPTAPACLQPAGRGTLMASSKTRTPHVYAYEKDGNTLYYVTFYCKQWDGTNKKIKKMGFTRQADAAQYERDYRDKLAGSPSMTFGALCDRYLDDLRNHVKESTWFNRQNVIKLRLLPVFSDVPISDITPAMIREWQNTVIAGNTFKPSYLANIHGTLATVFNFACKYFGLAQNPATIAGGMGTLKRQHDINYWTREQFARFILSGLKPEYVAIFATLFWTGCRVGECLALTAADIDLTQGTMNINKTVTYAEHGFTIGTPKTASSRRVVTLPKHLCMILADWIKRTDARGNDRLLLSVELPLVMYCGNTQRKLACRLSVFMTCDILTLLCSSTWTYRRRLYRND